MGRRGGPPGTWAHRREEAAERWELGPQAPRVCPPEWQSTARPEGPGRECSEETRWDFLGSPVAITPRSQCRGPEFDPWSGN